MASVLVKAAAAATAALVPNLVSPVKKLIKKLPSPSSFWVATAPGPKIPFWLNIIYLTSSSSFLLTGIFIPLLLISPISIIVPSLVIISTGNSIPSERTLKSLSTIVGVFSILSILIVNVSLFSPGGACVKIAEHNVVPSIEKVSLIRIVLVSVEETTHPVILCEESRYKDVILTFEAKAVPFVELNRTSSSLSVSLPVMCV